MNTSKMDRQGSRTPAQVEQRSGLVTGEDRVPFGQAYGLPGASEKRVSSQSKPSNTELLDRIAPGKNTLFYGSAPVGSTITVENTELYDLFAIRFQVTAAEKVAVLAYKIQDMVRGIGGWAPGGEGELQVFSASIYGNTWKILGVDAFIVGKDGHQDSSDMRVLEIIGIV